MISCAFGACRRTNTEYRFVAHPLGTVDRVLVAAPASLDRFGPIATKADLVEHPFHPRQGHPRERAVAAAERRQQARIRADPDGEDDESLASEFDTILACGGIGVVQAQACVNALARGKSRAPHHHACR
ncbi:hypothetical protein [Burkholderia diffusa]|uniref:hypothetical protein n=1 Tax=Burkholderia diffusa TaxID=488732 RepID=UPI001FD525DB|nr:hypothetical protein [Burkholderia diffusa]